MTEYFAVIDGEYRQGPFYSIGGACRLLNHASKDRHYTDEQARHFFLYESAVEQVDTLDGKVNSFRLNWLTREESGRGELFEIEFKVREG